LSCNSSPTRPAFRSASATSRPAPRSEPSRFDGDLQSRIRSWREGLQLVSRRRELRRSRARAQEAGRMHGRTLRAPLARAPPPRAQARWTLPAAMAAALVLSWWSATYRFLSSGGTSKGTDGRQTSYPSRTPQQPRAVTATEAACASEVAPISRWASRAPDVGGSGRSAWRTTHVGLVVQPQCPHGLV
jgi:hypothetical protein